MNRLELHLHLEGAAPPDLVRALAAEKKVDLAGLFREDGGYAYGSFPEFLRAYEAAASVIVTPEDYARLTRAVLHELYEGGVAYCEVFTAPSIAAANDLGRWREHCAAIAEAAAGSEVILRTIPTCVRHEGPEVAKATARCAAETAGGIVVGFGMGGDETMGKATDFAWAFDCAREAGLGLTCHAGEFGGPESVREALALGVSRIGHGVRAAEDEALVDRLAEDGIVLEVCPGSNVALGLYPDVRRHPIERLRARGVRVTVSTDDPPFFRTTLAREYEALAEAHDWDDAQFRAINVTAAEAAFCDEDTRAALLKRLEP